MAENNPPITAPVDNATDPKGHDGDRRDFIYLATGAAGVIAVGGIAWPLVAQMAPNAREEAAGAPVQLDVSGIEPGQVVTVVWRGAPYFVRHLTDEEITLASDAPETTFRDFAPLAARTAGPGITPVAVTDGNDAAATGGDVGRWAIMAANCTHLGCVPSQVDAGLDGWVCPCHGSIFDVTGRVTKGPAAVNLPLPPFNFASEEVLVIGAAA
ncbi:MAG: ubiquinol-cytochrome c reductase iron-sulfur subunit [Pseudomonadota bacterium]